jgi:hypothetical protein
MPGSNTLVWCGGHIDSIYPFTSPHPGFLFSGLSFLSARSLEAFRSLPSLVLAFHFLPFFVLLSGS